MLSSMLSSEIDTRELEIQAIDVQNIRIRLGSFEIKQGASSENGLVHRDDVKLFDGSSYTGEWK